MPAAVYPTRSMARERSAVLLAMGLTHWVAAAEGGFALLVETAHLPQARAQIEAYDAEQRDQASAAARAGLRPQRAAGWKGLIVASVVFVCLFQWQHAGDAAFTDRWCRDSVAIFDRGEWWRAVTALFLHGDVAHLAGNLFFGGLIGVFVARSLGPWTGWGLIAASGVLGNLITAWVWYPDPYKGIGASTAVFGAVGILVADGLVQSVGSHGLRQHRAWLLPLGGGLALLGLFGSGSEDGGGIDLAAHLFGFVCGLPLGLAAARLRSRRADPRRDSDSPVTAATPGNFPASP